MYVCIYVCMYEFMYVCSYVPTGKLSRPTLDGACEHICGTVQLFQGLIFEFMYVCMCDESTVSIYLGHSSDRIGEEMPIVY